MKRFTVLLLLLFAGGHGVADDDRYVVLDEKFSQLMADFNAMSDKVRLLFIVGPSCGICLRGMADLNDAFIAARQGDARLQTLVLHVPVMGAEERHVEASIQLLDGPRIKHYWDPEGRSGLLFQETLELPIYAWDVWLVYPPGARWVVGEAPPKPSFWQHQLGSLEPGKKLDARAFAAETLQYVEAIPSPPPAAATAVTQQPQATLIPVSQPRGVMIRQNLEGRGGYPRLKRISRIDRTGSVEVNGQRHPLCVSQTRPDLYTRRVDTPAGTARVERSDGRIVYSGSGTQPLPRETDVEILDAFEFDGWLADWKDKGHKVRRLGMIKQESRLPWVLEVEHRNGQVWRMFIDSHTGDAYRLVLMNGDGAPQAVVEYDDYRDVDGYRMAHTVRHLRGGAVLAVERYDSIRIDAG